MAAVRNVARFTDIPNVGPATAEDFAVLGLSFPADLVGRVPIQLYEELCYLTGQRHDPCVIDVFMAAVDYMEGGAPKRWWEFTARRKQALSGQK